MSDDTTLPEGPSPPSSAHLAARETHALVVIWSADEPWRVGTLAFVPAGTPGPLRLLGRGTPTSDEAIDRVVIGTHQPIGFHASPPLSAPTISRVQLRLQSLDDDTLHVENVGRCPLYLNDEPITSGDLRPGDLLRLGQQMVFLFTRRPVRLGAPAEAYRTGAFGAADAHGIIGESPSIWGLREQLAFIASRTGHVLLRGASGTGKELAARAVHALSVRNRRPMVARNAATIPESIADAELFGNAKNYPNPGMPERPGLIGEADGSTLYLDEFADLPLALQAHLLRVLDQGEYQRLGESTTRRSLFRLLGATNRPYEALKHDLGARFPFRIEIPDLNARREDIPLLARHLVREIALQDREVCRRFFEGGKADGEPRLSRQLMVALVRHHYTTNVRELQAFLWQSIAASPGPDLKVAPTMALVAHATMPPLSETGVRSSTSSMQSSPATIPPTSSGMPSAEEVQATLDRCNGSLQDAWQALGLKNRHVLARLIAKYGLEVRRRPGNR